MNTWFFSKKGKVTGPLTIAEAIVFVANNANCYGWNPHFAQWKPVTMIAEFVDYVPAISPPAQIPQSLVDDFVSKKDKIHADIILMDDKIKFTKTYLYELEQEINIYKRLTSNLSADMKSNINPYVQSYENFNRLFEELATALTIAKGEVNDVVLAFDKRVEQRKAETSVKLSASSKAFVGAQDDVIEPRNVDVQAINTQTINTIFNLDPIAESPKKSGMSSMLKSVFKTDSKKGNALPVVGDTANATSLTQSASKVDSPEAKDEIAQDEKPTAPHYWNMLNAPRTIY